MDKETFKRNIQEWTEKVIRAYETEGMTDTAKIMIDIDKIIADGFDREPIFEENF